MKPKVEKIEERHGDTLHVSFIIGGVYSRYTIKECIPGSYVKK
jgi:hypothetical protein